MIEVSVETLATVLTGLGLVIAIFSAMAAFSSTLRKEIKAVDENLRQEITGLRGEMKAELRSLNDRLDGTNLRIDRLVDSLRVPATA